ncbi:hypothetical protein RJ639_035968 [Escallonia herrerae]|uniref:Formin-like protein n=1 Tax=Escallonia herrerae TaxID=1293975 RepID=A0AA89BH99_9ASTE|nr:hypothetical protein RJ639_035968 [Escallonia herrerae]
MPVLFFTLLVICASTTTTTTAATHNRRILHQPFFPQDTSPPTQPPSPSPPLPKLPFSTSTPTPSNESPFFPSFPSPPPPPASPSSASFPANISSLSLPQSPKPKPTSSKLIATAVAAVLAAISVVSVIIFLHIRKRRKEQTFSDQKTHRSDTSSRIFSNGAAIANVAPKPPRRPSQASSEFLYLGTLVNSHSGIGGNNQPHNGGYGSESDARSSQMQSPELHPLPPLNDQSFRRNYTNADVGRTGNDDDEEFYSPRGSSNGPESSIGTGSASRRMFAAVAAENLSTSSSYSSSSSNSPVRSVSLSISPPVSSSPVRSRPKSPELTAVQTAPPPPPPPPQLSAPSFMASSPLTLSAETDLVKSQETSLRLSDVSDQSSGYPARMSVSPPPPAVSAPPPPVPPLFTASSLPTSTSPEKDLMKSQSTKSDVSGQNLGSPAIIPFPPPPAPPISAPPPAQTPIISVPPPPAPPISAPPPAQTPIISVPPPPAPPISAPPPAPTPIISVPPPPPPPISAPPPAQTPIISVPPPPAPPISAPPPAPTPIISVPPPPPPPVSVPPPAPTPTISLPPPLLSPPRTRGHWKIPTTSGQQPLRVSVPPPAPPPPPPPPQQQRIRRHWEIPTTPTPPVPVSRPPVLVAPSRPAALHSPNTISPMELPPTTETLEANEETPKLKLKPLHWDKVRASSDREMVWDQLKSSSFKLDEEMIETLFVVRTPNSSKDSTRGAVLPLPRQENRVLDPKKSQNIAILLRAINVTVEEVCEALLEGNADTLGTELLESLLKMAPTKEEERKVKEYKDDSPVKLGPAERFLKAVLDIPHAFKRVDAMLYVSNFDSEIEYLKKSFETLEAACEELRNSRMFLKLLEAVLKTGNRMNVGTNRGDAHAFKLDTLLKLVDVKGADGKTTLLHFVVQEIIRSEGARLSGANQNPVSTSNDDAKCRKLGLQVVSGLSSDLANVKKAAAMDSEVLNGDVLKLSKGIGNIGEVVRLNEAIGSEESSRRFSESMNKFVKTAEEEIIRIQAQESVALSLVKEITEYFHGNSAKEEAHPFRIFMVVRDFLTVLDRVCKEVGLVNERTMVSSAHKFPVPVNPNLQPVFSGFPGKRQFSSSDDDSPSP